LAGGFLGSKEVFAILIAPAFGICCPFRITPSIGRLIFSDRARLPASSLQKQCDHSHALYFHEAGDPDRDGLSGSPCLRH